MKSTTRRRSTSERTRDLEVIADLRSKGWDFRKIARKLGVSETTVRRDAMIAPQVPTLPTRATAEDDGVSASPVSMKRIPRKGRVSKGRSDRSTAWNIPVPPSYDERFSKVFNMVEDWRLLQDPSSVVLLLARHSPEFSKAWWDLLLMSVGGWEIDAMLLSSRHEKDEKSQIVLNAMLDRIGDNNGSLHNVLTQFVTNGFFRGAFAAELVLSDKGRKVADISVLDPSILRYRPVTDTVLGDIWELGQVVDRQWVSLDIPTVKYLPLHPLPGDPPYGTPPVGAAAMPAIFLLSMFYDIKRVIEKQGFGRLDVTVFPDRIVEKLGTNPSAAAKKRAVSEYFIDVAEIMEELEPDDVFVHTDDSEVNRAPGAGGESGSLSGIDRLIDIMEKQVIRALKSMPLIQGVTDSVSEGNANRQWEVYAKGVRVIQQYVENLLSYLLELGMMVEGTPCFVKVRLAEIRAVDEYREAQMRLLKTQTAVLMETVQYMDADEAAEYANGQHGIPDSLKAYREEVGAPTTAPANNPAAPESNNPDAKAETKGRVTRGVEPEGADDNFPPVKDGKPTDREVEQILKWFDRTVPLGAGVLDADPEVAD